jgi:hypothetical protein
MGIWGFAGSRFRALDGCVTDKSCGGGDIFLSVTRMQCPRCHREMTSDEPVYRRVRGVHIGEGCAGCSTDFPPAPPGWSHAPQWRAPSPCKRCGRRAGASGAGAEPVQAVRASSHPRPAAEAAEARPMQPPMPPKNVEDPLRCATLLALGLCLDPQQPGQPRDEQPPSCRRQGAHEDRSPIFCRVVTIGPPGLSQDEGEFVWYPPSAGATRACRGLSRPRKRRGSTAGEKIIRFRQ